MVNCDKDWMETRVTEKYVLIFYNFNILEKRNISTVLKMK